MPRPTECQRCKSKQLLGVSVNGKDRLPDGTRQQGYAIWFASAGGDYTEFVVCADCGQMQGVFPLDLKVVDEEAEADADG